MLLRLNWRHRSGDANGDLLELFHRRTAKRGIAYARRRYLSDVLSILIRPKPPTPLVKPGAGHRGAWGVHMLNDLRFAARLFCRQSAIMAITVVGLALAIGVNTAAFSVVSTFSFRPVGVPDLAAARCWRVCCLV